MAVGEAQRQQFDVVAAAAIALVVALFPLTSADLWWHLASGREIWRRGGIPFSDPFSFASDPGRWLDHGWLFQALVYPIEAAGGPLALQLVQLLLAFGIALVVLRQLARDALPREAALVTVAIAMIAAKPRLTLRPELVTLLFLCVLLAWLRRSDERPRWLLPALACLSLVWTNLHPGAILGALVVLIWCAADALERREWVRPASTLAAFCVPLVMTPYGVDSLLFPFRLRALVTSGGFVNPEWLPARFDTLPAPFLLLVASAIVVVAAWREAATKRIARLLIVAVLAFLALRYQRNAGMFAVALPLLLGPELAALARAWSERTRQLASVLAAVVLLASFFTFAAPGVGINHKEIAVDATDFAKRAGIRGHMFNQARFGGYLIWALYPDTKVLIDGRNEVYTRLLPRLAGAIGDDRQWRQFLRDEQIEWAILGYNNPPQRVVTTGSDGARRTALVPFAVLHFPPREWALVYRDEVAFVLVRRNGVNARLVRNAPRVR